MINALAVSPRKTVSDVNVLFGECTEKVRQQVMDKVAAMQAIDNAIVTGEHQKEAIMEVARAFHGRPGFSTSKLTKDYALWSKGGQKPNSRGIRSGESFEPRDWKMFIPTYNNGNPQTAQNNTAFVRYIRQMHADTCRADATGNALHERLLDEWFSGMDIPGYGNIIGFCAKQGLPCPKDSIRRSCYYPNGWSVDNLRRMIPRAKAYRALVQRGEHAAHDHWGDQLLRDRSNLRPFELITFDDVRFDIRVVMPMPGGKAQAVTPVAVFALDVATGLILSKGVAPAYTREEDSDGGKAGTKRGVKQADVKFLLLSLLERFGMPKDWQMNFLLENASASLGATEQEIFKKLTGVDFENTGLVHRKLINSGFIEQGGMPWQKGWVESFFRLLHCRINHLEGTIGSRYQLTSGDLNDKVRYTLKTIEEAQIKGISVEELDLPLLTLQQFHNLLDEYVMRLNCRVNHKLQGFSEVYEIEAQPGLFLRYDDPRASAILKVGDKLTRRMESPAERFGRLIDGARMESLHPYQLLPLAMEKRPVTVRAGKITISRTGQDNLVFQDAESAPELDHWAGKEKALIGFMSADKSCIHLFSNDADLRYVASPRQVRRIDLRNGDEILERAGEVDRGRERIREMAREVLIEKEHHYADMRKHNSNLLNVPEKAVEVAEAISAKEEQMQKAAQRNHELCKRNAGRLQDICVVESEEDEEPRALTLEDLY